MICGCCNSVHWRVSDSLEGYLNSRKIATAWIAAFNLVLGSIEGCGRLGEIAQRITPFVSPPFGLMCTHQRAQFCNLIHPWVVCYGPLLLGNWKVFLKQGLDSKHHHHWSLKPATNYNAPPCWAEQSVILPYWEFSFVKYKSLTNVCNLLSK